MIAAAATEECRDSLQKVKVCTDAESAGDIEFTVQLMPDRTCVLPYPSSPQEELHLAITAVTSPQLTAVAHRRPVYWYMCCQRNDNIQIEAEYKKVFCGEIVKDNYYADLTPQSSRQEFWDSTDKWISERARIAHLASHASSKHGLLWVSESGDAEPCRPEALAQVFCHAWQNGATVDLVFLNACETVHTVCAVLKNKEELVNRTISFVCWATEAADGACISAAREFYKALDTRPDEYKRAYDSTVAKLDFDSYSGGFKCPKHYHGAAGALCFVEKLADGKVNAWIGSEPVDVDHLLRDAGCSNCRAEQMRVWQTHVDQQSGDSYYHNTDTDEVTWERPVTLQHGAEAEAQQSGLCKTNCLI